MDTKPAIVIVHGLFMQPSIMIKMERFFKRREYHVYNFDYDSRNIDLAEISVQISEIIDNHDEVHFIGHSLGGLIIRQVFEILKPTHKGIVVTLGTPHQGSAVAEYFYNSMFRWVLGNAPKHGLLEAMPYAWSHSQSLYSIAGTKNVGPLALLPPLYKKEGDGTVLLKETFLDGAKAHIHIDASHTVMVYSSRIFEFINKIIKDKNSLDPEICNI
jgi:pimeloyl-ACP methyl ester carboxylesterase